MPQERRQSDCHIAESLGEILRQARLEYGWELDEISERLGVPEKWLAAAEADRWADLPDDAYSRIYFKSYCQLLELEPRAMQTLYRQTHQRTALRRAAAEAPSEEDHRRRRHPTTAVPTHQLVTTPQLIRRAFLAVIGIGLASYFWWATANIVTPPKITVTAPVDGIVVTDRSVTVTGQTESEVTLRVNGKEVTTDSDGFFQDTLELADGLNVIKVVGAKKHSKETVVTRRIIVELPDRPTAVIRPLE